MHAVVSVWQRDADRFEEQERQLKAHIVPGVRHAPGFVAGYWTYDHTTAKRHVMIVLDSEPAAQDFIAGVKANSQGQAAYGMMLEMITVVDVTATAQP